MVTKSWKTLRKLSVLCMSGLLLFRTVVMSLARLFALVQDATLLAV